MFILGWISLNAVPAYPKKIPVHVGDSVIYIRLFGDENSKRAETLDGYTLLQKSRQWFYAERDTSGFLVPSAYALSCSPDDDTQKFLDSTPLHLTSKFVVSPKIRGHQVSVNRRQPAVGNRRILVILMQYKDLAFKKRNEDFEHLFNQSGYTEDGAQGSVYDFYADVSYGQLQLESDVIGPFTSRYSYNFYGKNDRNGNDSQAERLFEEAVEYAATEVALSDYDADGDGFVDNVHIIFAGYGEVAGANQDAIWSHEATLYTPYEIQGMKIDRYSCAPELRGNSGTGISRIGPHCHEIGHALGAMDYYDTNYSSGGAYEGTGMWDVMASGSWNNDGITPADFNPYVKMHDFGWISPQVLPSGNVNLQPSCDDIGSYYILGASASDEYYLLENRSKKKWGAGIPGEGLLIFHIHSDVANVWNNINVTAPQMCYVVCASSKSRYPNSSTSSYGEINSDGCPYPGSSGNRNFGTNSTPEAFYWDEKECGIELNDIVMESDGGILLTNNSTGSIYEPIERERIFFEDFERDVNVNILEDAWTIEEVPTDMKNFDRLLAYDGNRSLQISARKIEDEVRGSFEFSCPPTADQGKYRIKLYIASRYIAQGDSNVIKIGYKKENDLEWRYHEVLSEENSKWKQAVVRLPESVLPYFRIEGVVSKGSILGIDNIEVEQEIPKEDTSINDVLVKKGNALFSGIYTLMGHPVSSIPPIHPYIYIKNGKKIYVK